MKTFLFSIVMLMLSLTASAGSMSKRVFNHNTPEGSVYFVGKKKLGKVSKGVKYFEYDLTYPASQDSVTVNFTVISDNANDVQSVVLTSGSKSVTAMDISLLYHEIKGSKYVVRTTSKILYKDMKELYSSMSPLVFHITHTDGKEATAEYSTSEWKKENKLFNQVFYLINK